MCLLRLKATRSSISVRTAVRGIALALLLWPCLAMSATGPALAGWTPVESTTLDTMRGGVRTDRGLEISLGIERLVLLNGAVVARNSFHITDMAGLSVAEARAASASLANMAMVQRGENNAAPGTAWSANAGATLIQNSVNGQQIDSRTVIQASVNSAGLLTSSNFHHTLRDALTRSAEAY